MSQNANTHDVYNALDTYHIRRQQWLLWQQQQRYYDDVMRWWNAYNAHACFAAGSHVGRKQDTSFGDDTIYDFQVGFDKINLDALDVADYTALLAATADVSGNAPLSQYGGGFGSARDRLGAI